jgi:hypothetical protein
MVMVLVPVLFVGGVLVAAGGVVVPVPVPGVEVATGGGKAATMTSNVVGVALLPAASVAVQVTTVVPIANIEPEEGVHEAVPAASTLSEVEGGVYETTAPDADVACTDTLA